MSGPGRDTLMDLLREINAAEALCGDLTPGTDDRASVEGKIAVLNERLLRALEAIPPSPPG